MAKALRVHNLAKELGVASKEIIAKCHAEGVELKNHMATVSLGLAESIREWFSVGDDVTTVEVAARVDLNKVVKRKPALKSSQTTDSNDDDSVDATSVAVAERDRNEDETSSRADDEIARDESGEEADSSDVAATDLIAAKDSEEVPVADVTDEATGETVPESAAADTAPVSEEPRPPIELPPDPVKPMGPQLVPKPAELKGPRVVRIEAPDPVAPPRQRPRPAATAPRDPLSLPPTPSTGGRKKKGRETEEEAARKRSARRATGKSEDFEGKLKEWRDQDLIERQERLKSATGHGLAARRAAGRRRKSGGPSGEHTAPRKGEIEIETPVSAKDFCAAVGIPFGRVFKILIDHTGRPWTVNESFDHDTVEILAAELGVDIKMKKARGPLETLQDEVAGRERNNLTLRPPVVTMLGHVDHGKTSLLDKIRKANVASGESGGITQHIGAYRIDRGDWHVTFLDTPGHAAFTAMRARGANMTDVVVLVVAADDGIMPQTAEAINHAKAAGVEIVVALNKIDLPGVDINQIYGQLSEYELVPTEWGGNTDVVKTSAVTGEGIDELIAHLSQLSELMELKADPKLPGVATVIEARMKEGRGNVAQVLVRDGTLRIGQTFVCGPASGRIRNLRNDTGKVVKEAGPGTPVEISGLDDLPRAGDMMYVVNDLSRAKEIAEEIRNTRRQAELKSVQSPRSTLEDLLSGSSSSEIPELNLIVKADVQGSVDALKGELAKLPTEKVRLAIKHAGVGAINEADVDLAHVANAIIFGFHVVADDRARRRADELGVEIRNYRVIYEILDDIQQALKGLLAPIQKQKNEATVEVRKVFNVSRLGTIAGCYVTDGTISRNHKVRLVRDGRVILENGTLESLKRFKDDAKEVRAGMECGIKIANYDDIKPGDQIQSYSIVEIAQEL
ncbi:MAG: translation initiation factor IF-2 [Phycisphaerae bacterium]